jgi:hypothetical protein
MVSAVLSAHDNGPEVSNQEEWRMSMAQVIEFDALARFTPTVTWPPNEQRGKVIPFMSQRREVSDELVCAAYEELDSGCSRWPERDEALYHAALE